MVFSSFFARLPAVKAELGASDGQLGLALFCATGGLVLAQPLAGALIGRAGVRIPALAGIVGYAVGVLVAALAGSVALLAVVLFAVGFANGVLDVAVNVHGVAVERGLGRRVLSSMHAAFSFGVMAGAGGGALAAAASLDPEPHLAIVAVVSVGTALAVAGRLPGAPVDRPRGPAFARPSGALAALGVAAFCVLLAEGAVTDWSAIYLTDETGAGEALAATGLTAFALLMALGRLGGDRVAESVGDVALVRGGSTLAAAGMGLALATAESVPSVVGFALMGVGLSATFPRIVAAAARVGGAAEAPAIGAVTGVGYAGLMAGPAAIGALSEVAGLRTALLLVVVLCVVSALSAGSMREGRS